MTKGGYQIIDLQDYNFTVGTEHTIPGVYEAIEGNYRKPILLGGLQVGSTEYNELMTTATVIGDNFIIKAYDYLITVADDDGITISSALVANQAASTATTVADLKTDFNALLTKLKNAGIMTADSE